MQKLILGIIAVICLDIGFAVFMGIDQPADSASIEVNTPTPEANPVSSPVDNLI